MQARALRTVMFTMLASGCGGDVGGIGSNAGLGGAPSTGLIPDGGGQTAASTGATTSCDDLRQAASTAFWNFVKVNQACATDSDCVSPQGTMAALCAAPCGYIINTAASAAAEAYATLRTIRVPGVPRSELLLCCS